MDYRIIALDLDGTLTNSKKEISPLTLHALLEIQKKGFKVVIATGRPTPGCRVLARTLQLDVYGSYILSYNGGQITDCSTGRIVFHKTLPHEVIPALFDFALANDIGLTTYTDTHMITGTRTDRYMESESKINSLPIKTVPDFVEFVDFDINKCLVTADPDHLMKVESRLKEMYGDSLNIYRSEPYFLEIMPKDIDKAEGLKMLLSELGLSKEQLISCGDGYNDITMIQYAGLGVAMENAQAHVKSIADYITSSNDNNGILHVIERFICRPVRPSGHL